MTVLKRPRQRPFSSPAWQPVLIHKETIQKLLPAAVERHITVDDLVRQLVSKAASDHLVDAILDDLEAAE